MSRTFRIDKRYIYPVSESCLELALYNFTDTSTITAAKDLAHQVIQAYILGEYLKIGEIYIEEEAFNKKFKELIKDFERLILVRADYCDVIFDNDKFEFKFNESGKLAVGKILGQF